MRGKVFFATFATMVLVLSLTASATQLIWTPINPAFGGSPLNGNWLLASATAQNRIKEPIVTKVKSPLETFQQNLQRQILSRLAQRLVQGAFGEEALEPGHYVLGNYEIEVLSTLDAIAVVIIDITTGEEVRVEIPYY